MPITSIEPLPVGGALRILLDTKFSSSRLLRKPESPPSGIDDPQAVTLLDSIRYTQHVDADGLEDGKSYWYQLFGRNGGAWKADGQAVEGVPEYGISGHSVDPVALVADRLRAGLNTLIKRGDLTNPNGRIDVLTAPPLFDQTSWPVVTVHLSGMSSENRALGEEIIEDSEADESGNVKSVEGWFAKTSLTVVAWSINPDERMMLRRGLTTILIGNLPVFEDAGMQQIDVSQEDREDLEGYGVPVYQTVTTISGKIAQWVSSESKAIRHINVNAQPVHYK